MRVLETDRMLECGRGLVMSFLTISTMDRFCHGSCDGSCKALPTGWSSNLEWFFRWLMRARDGLDVEMWDGSCAGCSYVGCWDGSEVTCWFLATAPAKVFATSLLSIFDTVLVLVPARVPETDWVLACLRGLVMSSGTVPTMGPICDGSCEGCCERSSDGLDTGI